MSYFTEMLKNVGTIVGSKLPQFFWALCVLVVGWVLAMVIARVLESMLKRTKVDEKLAPSLLGDEKDKKKEVDVALWISKIAYYFLLIIVIGAFLQLLGLRIITEPMQQMLNKVMNFFPNLFVGALFFFLAWGSATLLRLLFLKGVGALKLDQHVAEEIELKEEKVPLTKTIADVVYWLVFLLFLPMILESLGFTAMLLTVNNLWVKVMDYIPQIFLAAVTLLIGWFLARVIERITTNLLAALGIDQLSEKVGVSSIFGKRKLSSMIGLVVYIFILLNVLVMALEALQIKFLTQPFIDMLAVILNAVPKIFTAGAILIIAYIVGHIVSDLVKNLLSGIGFDSFFVRLGLVKEVSEGEYAPSQMTGRLVKVAIMFFAAVIACEKLEFVSLVRLGYSFLEFAGRIVLGLIIFVIGVYLANLATMAIKSGKGKQVNLLAMATKVVILIFSGAIALQQVIPESEIIIIGFISLAGTICLALVIAFGVGGIQIAAKKIEQWVAAIETETGSDKKPE